MISKLFMTMFPRNTFGFQIRPSWIQPPHLCSSLNNFIVCSLTINTHRVVLPLAHVSDLGDSQLQKVSPVRVTQEVQLVNHHNAQLVQGFFLQQSVDQTVGLCPLFRDLFLRTQFANHESDGTTFFVDDRF